MSQKTGRRIYHLICLLKNAMCSAKIESVSYTHLNFSKQYIVFNKVCKSCFDFIILFYCSCIENDVLFAKITPCMENGKGAVARNLHNGVDVYKRQYPDRA